MPREFEMGTFHHERRLHGRSGRSSRVV